MKIKVTKEFEIHSGMVVYDPRDGTFGNVISTTDGYAFILWPGRSAAVKMTAEDVLWRTNRLRVFTGEISLGWVFE